MPAIQTASAAREYLRDFYYSRYTERDCPTGIYAMVSRGPFRFAVKWPGGAVSIVQVGPRGGLFTNAYITADDWSYLQEVMS